MKKVKHLFSGMLAVLAVLLLTGCQWNENPVRTSLDILQTDLTLQVGESATRAASTESKDYEFIYSSSNPAVAIVDQSGKVTAMSEGTATITVTMPETKIGWYAAATREYKVIVNKVSAAALVDVDKSTPLTLVAQADGKITVTFNNGITLANDIHYTINGGAEQTIAKNTTGAYDIAVKKGDVVQLYSLNTSLGGSAVAGARGTTRAVDSGAKYINIRPSMKTEIYGNVMSLLKGKDNLESATALEANNAFYGLFAGADKLVNNADRLLVLPATRLTEGCYQNMFNGCKGIEKAPELPAPKLEKNCYQEMFYDCAKLNSVKCLATDITAENSTKDWLGKAGTEATGEKVLESVVPMTPNSDDGVPASWTTQTPAVWAANEYNEGSWDETGKKVVFTKKTAASDPTAVANSDADVTWDKGWYTVSGNVTITGNVTLDAETHLILQDGAQLTINGLLNGNVYSLYIYGQRAGDGKLNVSNSSIAIFGSFISDKTIEIHGGEITATSTGSAGFVSYGIKMYGGKLTATANADSAAGIVFWSGDFDVYGGEVEAINMAAWGIMSSDGGDTLGANILTVYGGKMKATGGNGQAICAKIKSGTPGIKFYFTDTEGAWGDGAPKSTATDAPANRYAKAE